MESQSGENHVHIVWPVSAIVRQRQLNMGNIPEDCQDTSVRNESAAGQVTVPCPENNLSFRKL